MQEALNNPHYKKIWEEINWKGRHPEAKSVVEALEMETKKFGCAIISHNSATHELWEMIARVINISLLKV